MTVGGTRNTHRCLYFRTNPAAVGPQRSPAWQGRFSLFERLRIVQAGFGPYDFTAEDNGIVWMLDRGRFLRYDPRTPTPPVRQLTGLITSVQLSGTSTKQVAKIPRPSGAETGTKRIARSRAPAAASVCSISGTCWCAIGL